MSFVFDARANSITVDGSGISITQQTFSPLQTLVDGANIPWDVSTRQVAQVTLEGNRTLDNPTNLQAGATYILIVRQDGIGNRTLAYGSAYKFPGGTAPTLSTAVNAIDIITFVTDGTDMFGVEQLDFQ